MTDEHKGDTPESAPDDQPTPEQTSPAAEGPAVEGPAVEGPAVEDPDAGSPESGRADVGAHRAAESEPIGTPADDWTDVDADSGADMGAETDPVPAADPGQSDRSPADPTTSEPTTDEFAPVPQPPEVRDARAYSDIPPADIPRADTAQFETGQFETGQFAGSPEAAAAPHAAHTTAPVRGNRGKIIALSAVGVVLLLVIGLVGVELYARNKVTGCLTEQMADLTGAPTSVSISGKPILWQQLSGEFDYLQIDTSDEAADQMQLHVRAEGIRNSDDATTVRSLRGTGFIPFERIVTLSRSAGSGQSGAMSGSIDDVTSNPQEGTIEVTSTITLVILPVGVSTVLRPVLSEGKLSFEVVSAEALGMIPVPPEFPQQIVDQVTESMYGDIPDEVQISNFTVTDQGIDIAMSGDNVTMESSQSSESSLLGSC